jgi:peroxiredoxin
MREMPSIEKLNQHFKGKGLTVLAIAEDAEGTGLVAPYTKKLGLTFEFGLDPRQAVGVQYGARDLPTTFLIDQAGRVIAAAKGARDWASPGALDYLGELLAQVPAR